MRCLLRILCSIHEILFTPLELRHRAAWDGGGRKYSLFSISSDAWPTLQSTIVLIGYGWIEPYCAIDCCLHYDGDTVWRITYPPTASNILKRRIWWKLSSVISGYGSHHQPCTFSPLAECRGQEEQVYGARDIIMGWLYITFGRNEVDFIIHLLNFSLIVSIILFD